MFSQRTSTVSVGEALKNLCLSIQNASDGQAEMVR